MATFSMTLIDGSRRTCWKVRLIPRRAIWRAGRRLDSVRREKLTLPEVSGSTPEMPLNIVLLPAPFGPIRAITSPALTLKLTRSLATRPPKRLLASVTSSSTEPASGSGRRASGAGLDTCATRRCGKKR
jgi:hypothetical protein